MSSTDTTRQVGLVVLVALALVLLLPVAVGGMGYGPMMGSGGTAVPGWAVAAALLVRLLGIVVLVGGGYLLYRAFAGSSDGDAAMEELRLAYARGDLSGEEYERRSERLRGEE